MNRIKLFEQIYKIAHLNEEDGRRFLTYAKEKSDNVNLKDPKLFDDEIESICQDRLQNELQRTDNMVNDYFESKSFTEFQNDFLRYLQSERNDMDNEQRTMVIRIFNEYCKKFENGTFRHEVKFIEN